MSKQDKLFDKLLRKPEPRDFTWNELIKLLNGFGFEQVKGKGSRRKFYHPESKTLISIHEPHPQNELKPYQVRDVVKKLKEMGVVIE